MNDRSRSALASAVRSFLEGARCLLLLRLEDIDIGVGGGEAGLRVLHCGDGLVAVHLRLLQRLLAGEVALRQRLLPVELELLLGRCGLDRDELRLGLIDRGLLGHDLAADAIDGRLLGRDLVARRGDRELEVAVVDGGDHVAFVDAGVVLDRDARDVAGNLGGERGVVGAHIGVIGRLDEATDRPVAVAEISGRPDRDEQRHGDREARAGQAGSTSCGLARAAAASATGAGKRRAGRSAGTWDGSVRFSSVSPDVAGSALATVMISPAGRLTAELMETLEKPPSCSHSTYMVISQVSAGLKWS